MSTSDRVCLIPTGQGAETAVEFLVDPAKFPDIFAADLPAEQAAVLAATQRPVAELAFSVPFGAPAWKTLPNWAVVATRDKAAGADVVRSMAVHIGAKITEVESSHLVMLSHPPVVTDVILRAVAAVIQAEELMELIGDTKMFKVTNYDRRSLLRVAAVAGVGVLFGIVGCAAQVRRSVFPSLFSEGNFPSLGGATTWLNSPPLTPASLRGKVVLVQFWTYTCVNWLRTLPYVRAWAEKYKDKGLVGIGAHTPEFSFEKNLDNIQREAKAMQVDYPIAVDSDYGVWNAFNNQYWPALYLIDAQGRIRYHHFGEGEYEQTEMVIQRFLMEAGSRNLGDELVSVDPQGLEVAADWGSLKTPETYVGYGPAQGFASPGGFRRDQPYVYALPGQLQLNQWAVLGDWTVKSEPAILNRANGRIAFRFHARDVNLVMGPAAQGRPVRFRVWLEGQPVGAAHGTDVDEQGNGTLSEQRTFQLVRQPKPIADRLFEIEFLDSGAEAFCFTFG